MNTSAMSGFLAFLLVCLCCFLCVFLPIFIPRKLKSRGPKIQSGSLSALHGEKEINIEIDFSQSKIKGLSEEEFLWDQCMKSNMGEGWREYWKTTCNRQLVGKFCSKANEVTRNLGLRLGAFPEAQYTALFQVQEVKKNGATSGLLIIQDNASGEAIAVLERFFGVGSKVGSFENLIGDAMGRLGTKLGIFLRSRLK